MKLVIFGLAISSSWGNGHATLWRGLCRALAARGHRVVFFERDVPYYAAHRDLSELPGGQLQLYARWDDVVKAAERELSDATVGMVTSFCPDAIAAERAVLDSRAERRVFYDLDTPVTLDRLARGEAVGYIGPDRLAGYDLVLSYTGGASLQRLRDQLGARRVAPLYGSVDPSVHQPAAPVAAFRADLSYIGTYAADRQPQVDRLFLAPAARLPARRFTLAGSQYPDDFGWLPNVFFKSHLPPDQHAAFYGSSRLTLNVTRRAMAETGYCPSGRLFEAAACGTPILTDAWPGLDRFYQPGEEIAVASTADESIAALHLSDAALRRMAARARERTLAEHTATARVLELERILDSGTAGDGAPHEQEVDGVGNHSRRRRGHADTTARVFQGAAAGWQPDGRSG
jgi:spore maturation protein CgeB